MLIGQTTAGDPLIRKATPLANTLQLYLAFCKVVTENGTMYSIGSQVTPHILVKTRDDKAAYEPQVNHGENTLDEEAEDRLIRDRVRYDPTLRRAVDLLLGLKALKIQQSHTP